MFIAPESVVMTIIQTLSLRSDDCLREIKHRVCLLQLDDFLAIDDIKSFGRDSIQFLAVY